MAPIGTVTVSELVLATITVALVAPKNTILFAAKGSKSVPLIVTVVPTGPKVGANDVIVGAPGQNMFAFIAVILSNSGRCELSELACASKSLVLVTKWDKEFEPELRLPGFELEVAQSFVGEKLRFCEFRTPPHSENNRKINTLKLIKGLMLRVLPKLLYDFMFVKLRFFGNIPTKPGDDFTWPD